MKHHRLSGPPAWQRRIVLFLMSLISATLLMFVVWGYLLWLERDAAADCEERGGEWNYETDECEGARWD